MEPVYGQGFFHLDASRGLYYTIIFDYYDPKMEYYRLLKAGQDSLRAEEENLKRNMQSFMDEERIVINGEDVKATVTRAFIEVRGDRRRPTIVFHVVIPFKPRAGVNVYENFYEPTVAEYDYRVYWILPPGSGFREIVSPGRVTIEGNIAVIHVSKGTKIDGYESVVFELR